MKYSYRLITIHITACLVFLSLPIFFSPDFNSVKSLIYSHGFRQNFSGYILLVVFFYANYYYFIPKFYFKRKTFTFIALLIVSYVIIAVLPALLFPFQDFGMRPPMFHDGPGSGPMHGPPGPMNFQLPESTSIFQYILVLLFSFVLRTTNKLSEAKSEKLKAEVSYLKAQINPHFLFNTLNSLYALTIEKSDDAPDAVLKLSGMMRYVVTESTNDFVPLEKELDYIRDYIDLQRLRISDEQNLEIAIKGNPNGKMIAPLVIIPFIENAFKYGINSEENWHINVSIKITETDLLLDVENNQVHVNIPQHYVTEQGIENTQKRLDFIYPGKHELVIDDNKETYNVHLKIKLS